METIADDVRVIGRDAFTGALLLAVDPVAESAVLATLDVEV